MKTEKRRKRLEEGEECFVLINMATHWDYKKSRIVRIENVEYSEKPTRVCFYDSPHCAVETGHIFRNEENAKVAVSQLNAAIKRKGKAHGEEGGSV